MDRSLNSSDRQAIADLAAVYAQAVDERDFERLRGVFTVDAELDTGSLVRRGIDEIVTIMEGLRRYESTTHLVGAQIISSAAVDTCTVVTPCTAHHLTVDGHCRTDRVMHIHYQDECVRTNADGWRIRSRRLDVVRVDERPLD
ncbi:MAG: nuclear transport factor 2 family protein [Actinomycetota bacterium]|nr:nuclear transport factor 2 family protein [Actinomycetota bacterium]MED5232674.1 nuclear transport factor 2 family protein [Actinomycetota bacterium]MED5394816.1 nuclear transport factor 2 family protein [Actinomycetota bacterium]MEE3353934.1 nuclear transport factor 2 family protein [Actinomycetota bacterium]